MLVFFVLYKCYTLLPFAFFTLYLAIMNSNNKGWLEMEFSLNDKLRSLRINRGLTQVDIANYLNMTRQGYAHYENGVRSPNYQTLLKLANLYQISVDELVDSKELPLEILHLYETSPYHAKKEFNYDQSPKNISIKVNSQEKELINMFRKLEIQDKNMLFYKLSEKNNKE